MKSTKLPLVPIGEILAEPLLNGKHQKGMIFGSGRKIVRMVDLYRGDTISVDSLDRVEYPSPPQKNFLLAQGDILINRTSLKREGVGKAVLIEELPESTYFDCSIIRIRPAISKVHPRFLLHALNGPIVRPQIMAIAKTATITTIAQPEVRDLCVPLPPLDEQRRIAAILDKADAIRRKRQEAIQLTEELLRSTFLEMFGNGLSCIEKPHQLPCGWTLRTIDELKAEGKYTCVGGPFGSNLTRTDYVDKGVPVIRGSNISTDTAIFIDEDFVYVTEEKANNLLQNLAYPGDVIFTQRGTLGQVALIPPTARHCRYLISQSQMKLTPFEEIIDPNYLVQYFRSQHALQFLNSRVLATGVPHINLGVLKAFPVVVPPILLQRKFAEFKQRRQILQRGAALHEVESDHLFSSLIQHAFRGEL